jgi:hypothetical protein
MTLCSEGFYLTLPSNSSSHFFKNSAASFSVKLPNALNLTDSDRWVVGLSEIHIPWSFYNVPTREQVTIKRIKQGKLEEYNIDVVPGYYNSIQRILDYIPEQARILHYDEDRNKVYIFQTMEKGDQIIIGLTPALQNILGFAEQSNRAVYFESQLFSNETNVYSIPASYPVNIEYKIPREINVCANIVKNQPLFGPLMRKISVDHFEYGQIKSIVFNSPHYIKIQRKYFDTIHIDLKDEHNQHLPFQFGISSVTLHFKKQ